MTDQKRLHFGGGIGGVVRLSKRGPIENEGLVVRPRGFESLERSYGSSLLTISRYFSMGHDRENHFSSCLILQNLGKSRKCDFS